jgi:4-carboxymuconolactone decarboxylase
MDKAMYDKGMAIRRAVMGDTYVDAALNSTDAFNQPCQDLVTEYCWGGVWGREGLAKRDRSMINLAMISILNRPHELKGHIRGALTNGMTREEISEVFLQVMVYAGAPAGIDSFRLAKEVFKELDATK